MEKRHDISQGDVRVLRKLVQDTPFDELQLEIADKGPGIEDIEMALTEGFSTATNEMREMGFGFGMGLPNMRKNSDDFSIESQVGVGTIVSAMIRLDSSA